MGFDFSSLSSFMPAYFMPEYWKMFEKGVVPDMPVQKEEEPLVSVEEYLHRGQVIQSCVRKAKRILKPAQKKLCDILKKPAVRQRSGYQRAAYVEEQIIRSIIRPVCDKNS